MRTIRKLKIKQPNKLPFTGIFLISIIFCFFTACEEDTSKVGLDLLPAGDSVSLHYDSLSISAVCMPDDPTQLPITNNSVNLLGSYFDPIFGQVQAGFITETLMLSGIDTENLVGIDSAALKLELADTIENAYYGRSAFQEIEIIVYELNQDVPDTLNAVNEEDYYNASQELCRFRYQPSSKDSIISIPMPQSYIDKLNNDKDILGVDSLFNQEYKGFYLTAEPKTNGGAIYKFDLLSDNSNLDIYYSESGEENPQSKTLAINSACTRINIYNLNHQLSEDPTFLAAIDNQQEDSVVYIQSMAGLGTKIQFNNIAKIAGKNILKAELIVKLSDKTHSLSTTYPPPDELVIFYSAENENFNLLNEYLREGVYYGLQLDELENEYRFNLSEYFQQVASGEIESDGLYIIPARAGVSAARAVLNSPTHSNPMKLYITTVESTSEVEN